ncbi:hypothetical protein EVAR_17200_1 [Eumeta japonica]|uniref:Uncharacterized protein n=1 Tax=Eumeta variegata TaxID=151549 RepID=A0A4C1UAD2_EUMVA|nr:hypothetical protein EVAR_17200_1 [Eumeta japonica]
MRVTSAVRAGRVRALRRRRCRRSFLSGSMWRCESQRLVYGDDIAQFFRIKSSRDDVSVGMFRECKKDYELNPPRYRVNCCRPSWTLRLSGSERSMIFDNDREMRRF